MTPKPSAYAELVAASMLRRHGVKAIWLLHELAAKAYRDGNKLAAASIIDIGDAAEKEWHRRQPKPWWSRPKP